MDVSRRALLAMVAAAPLAPAAVMAAPEEFTTEDVRALATADFAEIKVHFHRRFYFANGSTIDEWW